MWRDERPPSTAGLPRGPGLTLRTGPAHPPDPTSPRVPHPLLASSLLFPSPPLCVHSSKAMAPGWGLGPWGRTGRLHTLRSSPGPELQMQDLAGQCGPRPGAFQPLPRAPLHGQSVMSSCPQNHTTFLPLPPNPKPLADFPAQHGQGPRRTTKGLSPQADPATACQPSGRVSHLPLPPAIWVAEPPSVAHPWQAACHTPAGLRSGRAGPGTRPRPSSPRRPPPQLSLTPLPSGTCSPRVSPMPGPALGLGLPRAAA